VFAQIEREQNGRLDILVNNVWGGYEHFNDGTEFWNEAGFWDAPLARWDTMFVAGVRAHYVCSVQAAPLMIVRRAGLIVTISFQAGQKSDMGVAYGAAKAADDHMIACMAHELRPHNICAVSLYPGLVRTEAVLKAAEHFDLSNSESPQFTGRTVAALAADPDVLKKSGRVFTNADLADEYGFCDVNGAQPTSSRFAVS
jgi:dehydrogenase/reductase SDR family protein 1